MIPDPFESQVRRALDAPAEDVARIVRLALVKKARTRGRRVAIFAVAAAVLLVGLSLVLDRESPSPVNPEAMREPGARLEIHGRIVLFAESAQGPVSVTGGERSRDRFRSNAPRILITQGGSR